jgi:import inner membrane translocase subunit TIM17
MGGLTHVRNRSPFLGGSFAMWGGVFSSVDCLLIYYRQKDDPWNAVIAGFITGGVLAIRGGLSVAFKNAAIGGMILLLIEGVSTVVTSVAMRQQYKMMEQMQKEELERIRQQMLAGKTAAQENPWAVDFNPELVDKSAAGRAETLVDKAKSFSF